MKCRLVLVWLLLGWAAAFGQHEPGNPGLEREYEQRYWAGVLSGGIDDETRGATAEDFAGRLDGWQAALGSEDWELRRGALMAAARSLDLEGTGRVPRAVAIGLGDVHMAVVEAALVCIERHSLLAFWPGDWEGLEQRLVDLTEASSPSLRRQLALAVGRIPAPVMGAGVEIPGLRAEVLGRLIEDSDPSVRGAARSVLLTMELPGEEWAELLAMRTALLHGLVVDGQLDELMVSLKLSARVVPDSRADLALSEWATGDRAILAEAMGGGRFWDGALEGLAQAAIQIRGGQAQVADAANSYCEWLLEGSDVELDLDAWRIVDQLLRGAAARPDHRMASELMGLAMVRFVGGPKARIRGGRIRNHGRLLDEDFFRDVFGSVASAVAPDVAMGILARHGVLDFRALILIEQFPRGLVASELHGLGEWLKQDLSDGDRFGAGALSEQVSGVWTWRVGPDLGIKSALIDSLTLGMSQRADGETEQLLMALLGGRFQKLAYRADWIHWVPDVFRALCSARFVEGGQLGPKGMLPSDEYFRQMEAGFRNFWSYSSGVRLDLLVMLPRVPELETFADLLILVGDTAGPSEGYRRECVELLGECRGVEQVARKLEEWLGQELELLNLSEDLRRVDQLELAGLARSIAANGASIGVGEDVVWELLGRGIKGAGAYDLGRACLNGLALYPGGLERGIELLLSDPRIERRLRVEAALLGAAKGEGELHDRSVGLLCEEYGQVEWSAQSRVLRALGLVDNEIALRFMTGRLGASLGYENSVECAALMDALTARGERRRLEVPVILAALLEVAGGAAALDVRADAIDGMVALYSSGDVVESGDGRVLQAAEELVRGYVTEELLADLVEDERVYLGEHALLSLARESAGGESWPDDRTNHRWLGDALVARLHRAADEDLLRRWRGEQVHGEQFAMETALEVGRHWPELLLFGEPALFDGRFLRGFAGVLGDVDAMDQVLARQGLIALGGEPDLDGKEWTQSAAQLLGMAWESGDWALAGRIADLMSWARRRGRLSEAGLRPSFGVWDPVVGADPLARIESMRFQAAAHLAEGVERNLWKLRAAPFVRRSKAAALDQAKL